MAEIRPGGGALSGYWTYHGEGVKLVTTHGTLAFEGTVLRRSSTVTMNINTIWWPTKEIDSGAIQSGTGELAGIHGHFKLCTMTSTYFVVHFE